MWTDFSFLRKITLTGPKMRTFLIWSSRYSRIGWTVTYLIINTIITLPQKMKLKISSLCMTRAIQPRCRPSRAKTTLKGSKCPYSPSVQLIPAYIEFHPPKNLRTSSPSPPRPYRENQRPHHQHLAVNCNPEEMKLEISRICVVKSLQTRCGNFCAKSELRGSKCADSWEWGSRYAIPSRSSCRRITTQHPTRCHTANPKHVYHQSHQIT